MSTRILTGDCRRTLLSLEDESVQTCVTSPPYWGLRSYLPEGHTDKHMEIGSEPTVDEWVQTMVDVLRQVRRVLRSDGTLFLNLGDSYAGSGRGGNSDAITGAGKDASKVPRNASEVSAAQRERCPPAVNRKSTGIKPKDMIGQPWMLAFALRADGWWLRQEIIWHKPNPMPESTRDRCTKAHEHVFLLTKSERYFWNFDAVQEPAGGNTHARRSIKTPDGWDTSKGEGGHGSVHKAGREKGTYQNNGERKLAEANSGTKNNESFDEAMAVMPDTRNPRSVWTIPAHGFKGAHFATFPPMLAERCITAGSRPGDVVLDPFLGAGTTALVAQRMGRHCVGCELDARSSGMARARIQADLPMFSEVTIEG